MTAVRHPPIAAVRVDWPRLILALRATGLTTDDIVAAVGCSRGAVHSWLALDCEPAHVTGCALLELHLRRCRVAPPLVSSRSTHA